MTGRSDFLSCLVGKPYAANAKGPDAYDCWHLAVRIERELFARELPSIEVPEGSSLVAMMEQYRKERARWREILPHPSMDLIGATDGALVLMMFGPEPSHIGVWLIPERRIIHADATQVRCEDLATLRANGWKSLRFFEPKREGEE
jgi:hypothetical protein